MIKQEDDEDEIAGADGALPSPSLQFPTIAIAEAMLRRQLTASERRAAKNGQQIMLTIVVPGVEYLASIVAALEAMSHARARVLAFSKPDISNSLALVAGGSGGIPAIHVCADLSTVSPHFLSLTQRIVTLQPLDGSIIRSAMRRCCVGKPPTYVLGLDVSSLDFRTVCALIPRGGRASTVARALKRIVEAKRLVTREQLPSLASCLEYGPVRDWGMQVKADLAAWRQGQLSAKDLNTTALMASEPGQGKTFFAKVLAHELDAPLHILGFSEIFDNSGYLNNTIKAIKSAFAQAAAKTPSVLFLDEIDSFPTRGSDERNGGYFDALVNVLLVELDGVAERHPGMVVLAATNRPEKLDPALLRPGRLSNVFSIPKPGAAGLEHIFRVHLGDELPEVSLTFVAKLALGATPAKAAQWVKEARAAARRNGRSFKLQDLVEQILGNDHRTDEELRRVAVHEAGHALAACLLHKERRAICNVSLVQNAQFSGTLSMTTTHEISVRSDLENDLVVALAGRAAEHLFYGDEIALGSGGARGSDLWLATQIAAEMQAAQGLNGPLIWRSDRDGLEALLQTDPELRSVVDHLLQLSLETAIGLLRTNLIALEAISGRLEKQRVLSGREVISIVREHVLNSPIPPEPQPS